MSSIMPINKPSHLLDNDENSLVYSMIGSRCITVATTVAQLYFSELDKWTFQATGVLCFVRDAIFRSFFLRFYDLDMRKLKFEQEIYLDMQYNTRCSFFHQVEADNRVVGFNFVDNNTGLNEASELASALKIKVGKMADVAATRVANQDFVRPPTVPVVPAAQDTLPQKPQSDGQSILSKQQDKGKDKDKKKDKAEKKDNDKKDKEKKDKKKEEKEKKDQEKKEKEKEKKEKEKEKKDQERKEKEKKDKGKKDKDKDKHKAKLRREDISSPIDFQHVQHVGVDSAHGGTAMRQADLRDDPALKFLFGKFGQNFDEAMQSKTGQNRVDEFIRSKGGIEKIHQLAAQSGYVSFEQPEPPTPQLKSPLHRPPPTPPTWTPQPESPQQWPSTPSPLTPPESRTPPSRSQQHRSPPTPQTLTPPTWTQQPKSPQQHSSQTSQPRTPQTLTPPTWTPQTLTPPTWTPQTLTPPTWTPQPTSPQQHSSQTSQPRTPQTLTPPTWTPQPESPQQWPSPPSPLTPPESRTPPSRSQLHRTPPPPPPPRRHQ